MRVRLHESSRNDGQDKYHPYTEVKAVALDVPCARLYRGSGYAFFPGAGGGEANNHAASESLTFAGLKCNAGPHTVRFRHLVSAANNAWLTVNGRVGVQPPTPIEGLTIDQRGFNNRPSRV